VILDVLGELLHWLSDFLPTPGRDRPRLGRRLLSRGRTGRATVVGIRRKEAAARGIVSLDLALQVRPGDGAEAFRAGCRQLLDAGREQLHLGADVPVRFDGRRRVIVDWPVLIAQAGARPGWDRAEGWRPLRRAPRDGIEDRLAGELRPPTGTVRARATVVSATPTGETGHVGPEAELVARLRFDSGADADTRALIVVP